jgi:hypothetical protein
MFAKKLSVALIASGLLAGTAMAQTAWVEIEDDNLQIAEFGASVDQVEDWDVYVDGAKVGEVEEVVGTDATTPTALVVDFDGSGGFEDRDVVIELDQFSWENNQLVLNADAATVADFETWDD